MSEAPDSRGKGFDPGGSGSGSGVSGDGPGGSGSGFCFREVPETRDMLPGGPGCGLGNRACGSTDHQDSSPFATFMVMLVVFKSPNGVKVPSLNVPR